MRFRVTENRNDEASWRRRWWGAWISGSLYGRVFIYDCMETKIDDQLTSFVSLLADCIPNDEWSMVKEKEDG